MPFRILLILGALSAFGPMAIDFYLPAFPALAEGFATDVEQVQLTLAVYFVGLAVGQLVYGPLADRYGRRRPLLLGIALFTLASFACSFAPSLHWLIAARFVQALGGCAGMVISRAIVRDLCDPITSARVFSQLMLVMGLAPILAPLAGGLLLNLAGWQAIFFILGFFGVFCLLAVNLWLPETLDPRQPSAPLRGALGEYRRLFRDLPFVGHALTGGLAMAGMFAYIAGSPFVFIELYGVPSEYYGWLFGLNAAGFILFAQVNAWLVARRGPGYWARRIAWFYCSCGVLLLIVALARPENLWPLLLPLFGGMACLGILMPNTSACAMAGQGRHAGSASALLGSLQFGIAACAASAVGFLHDGSTLPMALVICGCSLLALAMSRLTLMAERRAGHPLA
ncbi:multidrug effflux MFS transporter [Stutzerimonas kirkiae]|uniref:Bcr/CflA family efflux transporter n=1 Tax=Stutzerimonas kirkiae TaxID=2211392 RepID=A0A4Q9RDY2_9GAMM|nr:multidrug effflux MFS transporter [Stutzerimonas kirkiae]TBU99770.1 Bcr/CflA family drug resistance efflux transporter [Stutzerimonas kirkiae]TBV05298.1 Bcr/CflA family drug resistance efflux transporter [Stutzerimonas kirkiae]TBV11732.1 Bcr/CflA family drug resistance efflux transporter [Stutzerimonas kirkiae]TBV15339.1 Bcr/CflA family drug resistance efflux transporter [Stutzerimonas kirkiae]